MTTVNTGSQRRGRRVVSAFAAAAGAVALTLAGTSAASAAQPGQHCVYSVSAHEYTCHDTLAEAKSQAGTRPQGRDFLRVQGEIIGATVFEDENYGGSSLTITVPEPCPKNGKVDFWLDLSDYWQDRISSVQAWSTCWLWLYPSSGDRAGPYKDNHSYVGDYINDRTVTVGLS